MSDMHLFNLILDDQRSQKDGEQGASFSPRIYAHVTQTTVPTFWLHYCTVADVREGERQQQWNMSQVDKQTAGESFPSSEYPARYGLTNYFIIDPQIKATLHYIIGSASIQSFKIHLKTQNY